MKLFKKGTEKPIEIFVALFIILAVAMLLLKMMKDSTKNSQDNLEAQQRQEEMDSYRLSSQGICDDLCSNARDAGCTLKLSAKYCLERYHALVGEREQFGYDINNNYDIDETAVEDVGFNYCEQNVYCSQMTSPPCNCKGGLTMGKCIEVLKEYYNESGLNCQQQIDKNIIFGECTEVAPTWMTAGDINLSCT